MAQRVDLLAKFHATRERHNLDLRPMSFHETDHLPEDGMDASPKVQVFLDEKLSRGGPAPLCACTQEHQEN